MRTICLIAVIVAAVAVVFAFRLVLFALASVAYLYLYPGVVATKQEHPHQTPIYVATGLLGWLVLPWFCALWYASRNLPNHQLRASA